MKNLFALVGFATVAFVGLGWYLGWYNLSRQPGSPGTQKFNLELSPNKVTTDLKKGLERVGEITERLTEEKAPTDSTPTSPSPSSTGPAVQLFTPPSAAGTAAAAWKTLDTRPPQPNDGIQPVGATSRPR